MKVKIIYFATIFISLGLSALAYAQSFEKQDTQVQKEREASNNWYWFLGEGKINSAEQHTINTLKKASINFVYIAEKQRWVAGQQYAEFNVVNAYTEHAVQNIFPLATLEITFGRSLSETEQAEFEAGLRIYNLTDNVYLKHLHEVYAMPVAGRNCSFYWRDNCTKLYYTPVDFAPGKTYKIFFPAQWNIENPWDTFTVLPLTGNLRLYEIIISDPGDWELATRVVGLKEEMGYVNCIVKDNFAQRIYTDTQIHIHGGSSTQFPKKSYAIEFPKKNLFQGFKDAGGVFQGARRRVILNANANVYANASGSRFFCNKLSYDLLRDIESRTDFYGAALAADSYFALVVINSRFWGVYQVTEDIDTGSGGWSTMKNRVEKLGFDSLGRGMLHKVKVTGKPYPGFGQLFHAIPETEHEYRFQEQGAGVRNTFQEIIPYPVYVQQPWPESSFHLLDFDFQLQAVQEKGPDMEVEPDLATAIPPAYDVFALSGDGVGRIERYPAEARVEVTFKQPVKHNRPVYAYFSTAFDYDRFYAVADEDKSKMFEWLNLDSVLLNIFFVRLASAGDNIGSANNIYQFANALDLESYRNAMTPPAKYYNIIWDCDKTFDNALVRLEDEKGTDTVAASWPPWIKLAKDSSAAQKRYANLFYKETAPNRVLTVDYYNDKLNRYLEDIGNALNFEEVRWDFIINAQVLRDYFVQQFSNPDFVRNYLLSLKPGNYIPPSPYIGLITPTLIRAGGIISIKGNYFGNTPGDTGKILFANGATGKIRNWSDTVIICIAPSNAVSGEVKVITEGGESNSVMLTIDSTPPVITHTPVVSPLPAYQSFAISAAVSDSGSGVKQAILCWRKRRAMQLTRRYEERPMVADAQNNGSYQVEIPGGNLSSGIYYYYIAACDNAGNWKSTPEYSFRVN
ncbi:MAG: CotH kinase family protein [Candidatus Omnitrophota bacterium]|nr:CotH kinase family protein [Candidatus Omnitrophota bacterium]